VTGLSKLARARPLSLAACGGLSLPREGEGNPRLAYSSHGVLLSSREKVPEGRKRGRFCFSNAKESPLNLALFDFDGTITTREMFGDFMQHAVAPRRLAVGRIVLTPLILGYKLGMVSANHVRSRVVDFGFRGADHADVQAAGVRFSRDVLPTVLRPMALERIAWHKAQGDTVVVVSGALDLYLSHWCRQHGLALLCSSLESSDGVMTGRYDGEQCAGEEKARRVRERYDLAEYPIVYAYGDTHEDLDLLELADRKYYRWQEVG
jgi:phosphatidylglycerophosphatase C